MIFSSADAMTNPGTAKCFSRIGKLLEIRRERIKRAEEFSKRIATGWRELAGIIASLSLSLSLSLFLKSDPSRVSNYYATWSNWAKLKRNTRNRPLAIVVSDQRIQWQRFYRNFYPIERPMKKKVSRKSNYSGKEGGAGDWWWWLSDGAGHDGKRRGSSLEKVAPR